MRKIKVDLDSRSYSLTVGTGAVDKLPQVLKTMGFEGPVVIVTDTNVITKTKRIMAPVLKKIPNDVIKIVVPASEQSKSLKVFKDTAQKISKKTRTHTPLVIALGGGVVGDLGGFIAASYRRGVPLLQIPTTLLSHVDSSIGGKVGIDLPEAKNLIGAFYQPSHVLMDTRFLKTLPVRQVKNGMGEVIKYGVIASKKLFAFLEENLDDILVLKDKPLEKVIYECASIKARVVEKDEFDAKGIRIALNFGHTVGHAIETAAGYSNAYNHGEAISVGMLVAGEIAVKLDMFAREDLDRMKALIVRAGLPVQVKGVSLKEILDTHKYDKKFVGGSNRFVLPVKIGSVEVIEDIPWYLIKTALKSYVR
ncbi:MAG: 3-dehydroquinate synthase [Candidatus Tantalella remota]|nr:3-dehydroquinate synthase [Candidatus Tantalella remota]